jgi:hypothetical protein
MDYLPMKWVQLNSLRRCATAACFKPITYNKWSGCYRIRCFAAAALPLLVSNGLRRCATAACFKCLAANEVGAIKFAASLPLRYRCLYVSNGLAANEVSAIEFATTALPLRCRWLLQMYYLQMKWVQLNSLRRCATAACFKRSSCNK